ncbi:amino acid adenylation domain-containing protein [Lactiplantibacillus plantarum]|uniref:amino acid adenylation domain-containing protein n=1 Tax=Lactiplantibacillus plantarum TaxID=1590 RepID=UPI003B9E3E4B
MLNTIITRFEEQVEKVPEQNAVVFGQKKLNYRQLDKKSNIVANYLIKNCQVKHGDIVPLLLDRSENMIVAIIAVLKAGAAYTALSKQYPQNRIDFIREQTNAAIIVDDKLLSQALVGTDSSNPDCKHGIQDLAYVVYTSGTTGHPKGVLHSNLSVTSHIDSYWKAIGLSDEHYNMLFLVNYVFSVATTQIFGALLHGDTLVISNSNAVEDIDHLERYINTEKINYFQCTPSLANSIDFSRLTSVKTVAVAGEKIPRSLFTNTHDNQVTLVNVYGQSEFHAGTTNIINTVDDINKIGHPVNGMRAYVVDGKMNEVTEGQIGEICFSGNQLANGYLNLELETQEHFIDNPFDKGVLCATGDLVKKLPNNEFEFIGRKDFQLNINGIRTEPAEIETQLLTVAEIRDVVVTSYKNQTLIAYYVSDAPLNESAIKNAVKNKLSSYMQPEYYKWMKAFPLNENGKIDRKKLPDINIRRVGYVAPKTEIEKALAQLYERALKVDHVGKNDNFFQLGANSLQAMQLANAIVAVSGKRLTAENIYNNQPLGKLAKFIDTYNESKLTTIQQSKSRNIFQMSPAEKRMFVLYELNHDSTDYNEQTVLNSSTRLDENRLKRALKALVLRHEILRTAFYRQNDHYMQKVLSNNQLDFTVIDKEISNYQELVKPFDLEAGETMRIRLIKGEKVDKLFVDKHHIITDGTSETVFYTELEKLYRGEKLDPVKFQYKDYSEWFNELDVSDDKQWWNRQLIDYQRLELATDYPWSKNHVAVGTTVYKKFDADMVAKLRNLAHETSSSEYMILFSVLSAFLSKTYHSNDFILGTVASGRVDAATENMLGMFINTLPVRVNIKPNLTVLEYLAMMKKTLLASLAHQNYQFEDIVHDLHATSDVGNPMFDCMFVFQNTKNMHHRFDAPAVKDSYETTESKFALTFEIFENDNDMELHLNYDSTLFERPTVDMLVHSLTIMLENFVQSLNNKLSKLSMITQIEKNQLLTFPKTDNHESVIDLFEQQVMKHPNALALEFDDKKWTYAELNRRVNRVANYLVKKLDVKSEQKIPLLLRRTDKMVVAILSVLKAGAAYVPVSLKYPSERINFITKACNAQFVIDDQFMERDFPRDDENLQMRIEQNQLAYLIFTSGTSGNPKGVMVEHHNLSNYVLEVSRMKNSGMHEGMKNGAFFEYVFDSSVHDLIRPFVLGESVVVLDTDLIFDIDKFISTLNQYQINAIGMTPSLAARVDLNRVSSLEYIYCGGEAITRDVINKYADTPIQLNNCYGPTETTVLSFANNDVHDLSIGRPIGGIDAYVLDDNRQLLPAGAVGNLYIGGAQVTRGYLNRAEETEKHYINNPFGKGIIYDTGDLVRRLYDDSFQYFGRKDFQVKIRGYRVELGEIEKQLQAVEGIEQAKVIAKDGNLIAYYISKSSIDSDDLYNQLSKSLADYMVPSMYMHMLDFPLTINGKLDVRALPEPVQQEEYVAPRNRREKEIADAFAKVLNLNSVSVKANFFRLGGNSIIAISLANMINVSVKTIFDCKTVANLAMQHDSIQKISKQKFLHEEDQNLSFAQERLFFIDQLEGGTNAYNIPMLLDLQENVDHVKLEKSIQTVIQRHEVLRTVIRGSYQQVMTSPVKITHEPINIDEFFAYKFHLSSEIPIRINIYHNQLAINVHHIAFDGWSTDIFLTELTDLYNGKDLPRKTVQYKDFAKWQINNQTQDMLKPQRSYWLKELNGYSPIDFPTDYVRPQRFDYTGDELNYHLSDGLIQQLNQVARMHDTSFYCVALSAFILLLSAYSNQNDVVVGTPIAGRHIQGTEDMIGFFVNSLAIRTTFDNGIKFTDLLSKVTRKIAISQANQDLPFEQLVEALHIKKDMSRNPIFQIMFSIEDNMDSLIGKNALFNSLNQNLSLKSSKFDFSLTYRGNNLNLTYATKLFKRETILNIVKTYELILKQIANEPSRRLDSIQLSMQEIACQHENYPEKSLANLFEEQVLRTPDQVAINFKQYQLTYGELNIRANKVAHSLIDQGIKPGMHVPILLPRNERFVIAILGVLKAGANYVPLSLDYPKERVDYILDKIHANLVIDDEFQVTSDDGNNLALNIPTDSLAYIIFTSGTTGKPKGVMVEQRGVVNTIYNHIQLLGAQSKLRMTHFANFVFDVSVLELFYGLLTGANIYLLDNLIRVDYQLLKQFVIKNKISLMILPPAVLNAEDLLPVNKLVVAGESTPEEIYKAYEKNHTQMFNAYGPTEVTVIGTVKEYESGMSSNNIGQALKNMTACALDNQNRVVPIGAIGELCIGGPGVARGYISDRGKTEKAFINHPRLGRLYRTGDMVKQLPSGDFIYLGRNDFQVKIRGFRVELGEIEARLMEQPSITRCLVRVHGTNLIAYYQGKLEHTLEKQLPSYMVPSNYVHLDKFPMTINGKIDLRKLPEPEIEHAKFVAPKTAREKQIAEEICGLLNLERVSVLDDFYELGGNSILALKLANHINLQVKQIFDSRNIRELAKMKSNYVRVTKGNFEKVSDQKLSFAQERLWFVEQFEDNLSAYNVPVVLNLKKDVSKEKIESALKSLVQRHEILRTCIKGDYQIVTNQELQITHDCINVNEYLNRPFNLTKNIPIRVNLYARKLVIDIHHMAFDGWSTEVFLRELHQLYYQEPLVSLTVQYKDFAQWQRKYVASSAVQEQLDFWKKELSGYETLNLPADYERPKNFTYRGKTLQVPFNNKLEHELLNFAKKQKTSLYTVMLSVLDLMLSRFSYQNDIIVGTPLANRNIEGTEDLIGFFINTLPIRTKVDEEQSFKELLSSNSLKVQGVQNMQDIPFEQIVKSLNVERDSSRNAIFQVLFSVQDFSKEIKNSNLFSGINQGLTGNSAKYDLSVMVENGYISFNYCSDIYKKTTISSMLNTYMTLLEKLLVQNNVPMQNVGKVDVVARGDVVNYPKKTVVELFKEQVAKTPQNVAIEYQNIQLTYETFDKLTNKFANSLLNAGIRPGDKVPLIMKRSEKMSIAIWGVLKAGCAYVPVSPEFPEERKQFILKQINAKVIVDDNYIIPKECSTLAPKYRPKLSDLAYIIFTSGTTGKPKGVMIEHGGLSNRIQWMNATYPITEKDRVYQKTNFVFDVSVWEQVWALLEGARIVFALEGGHKDPVYLANEIDNKNITVMHFVPSMLDAFLETLDVYRSDDTLPNFKLTSLKYVFCSGEALNINSVKLFRKLMPATRLFNLYGPTEASIDVTYFDCNKDNLNKVLIGKPVANTNCYVLSRTDHLLPVGAIGELALGGVQLARGYINQPELTAQKFVINAKLGRIYKTGDLVRLLSNGNIEYLGRNDMQVKVRGLRIELGEVETRLIEIKGITKAIVLAVNQQLVAYYISGNQLSEESIKQQLSTTLPDYMVPSAFVKLNAFPLTFNGKLDRRALPKPTLNEKGFIEPKTQSEFELQRIFAEVLGINVSQVSVTESFFRLGGDSIKAIQLSNRIEQQLHQTITIKQIFATKSIRNMAMLCGHKIVDKLISEQGTLTGEVQLSSIQKWFFDEVKSSRFIQAFKIKLPSNVDYKRLKVALTELVNYHDVLRMRFDGQKQMYSKKIESVKLQFVKAESQLTDSQVSFDLNGILYRFVVDEQDNTLIVICHHLIIDTVSWQILADDLNSLYNHAILPAKGTSYRQWITYTKKHPSEFKPVTIGKYNNDFQQEGESQTVIVSFDRKITDALLKRANRIYHTKINDVLLTALARSLKVITKTDINYVRLESHGRAELSDQLNVHRTVGWFTAMYPQTISTDLLETKHYTSQVRDYGVGYGERFGIHDDKLPGITFNYLGQLNNGELNPWSVIPEDTVVGKQASTSDFLQINGAISEQKLSFEFVGKQSEVSVLAKQYYAELGKLIEDLSTAERTYLTVEDIEVDISKKNLDSLQQEQELQTILPANKLQEGFIYQSLNNDTNDDAYVCSYIFDYDQPINVQMYRRAWKLAQDHFPSLRLALSSEYGTLLQVIPIHGYLDFNFVTGESVENVVHNQRIMGFDLKKGSLLRVCLVKNDANEYTCVLTNHHAISDGWSNPVLLNYVHTMYANLMQDKVTEFSDDSAYVNAQRYLSQPEHIDDEYWQKNLSEPVHPDLNGLFKLQAHEVKLEEVKRITDPKTKLYRISGELYRQLKRFTKENGITTSIVLQYAWHKLLSIYGGVSSTTVGVVNAGRNIPIEKIEDSVGLYIRTLPIQFSHTDKSINYQLHKLQDINNECMMHSNVSLAGLQRNGTRLFDTLFVYENYPVSTDSSSSMLKVHNFRVQEKLDYPLTVMLSELSDSLSFSLMFAGEIFAEATIDHLFAMVQRLVSQIVKGVNSFTFIEKAPNFGTAYYPEKTIAEEFELQVREHPNNIALDFKNIRYTFEELNQRANRVAHTLVEDYDIKLGDRVPLLLPKSENTIIAILAILKAGAVYVPMAVTFPKERIKYIVEKVEAKLVIDSEFMAQSFSNLKNNLNLAVKPNDLAYIIFTSGTTGQPKGVMVEHRNFIIYLSNILAAIKKTGTTNIEFGCIAEYVFDIFGTEVFGQLLRGKTVNLFTGEPEDFPQFMASHDVTTLQSTPGRISYFFQDNDSQILNTSLTTIMVGGEKMNAAFAKRFDNINLINIYGPTEGTVWTSMKRIESNYSNIGQPFPNYTHLVLDRKKRLLPQGAVGELYISGPQLSRGYYGQPELTQHAFLNNPYNDQHLSEYSRIYKTGDIVRVLSNGEFELIGRNDFQVKIRGFRIELGEIESAMLRVPGVKQVLALALGKEGSKYLGVYYVSNQEIARKDIERVISQYLTDYMMPSGYQHISEFPLTINGKIDRRALPEISYDNGVIYVEPQNSTEEQVKQIVCDLLTLKLDNTSMLENFFTIGGDSIKVIKLISILKNHFGKQVTIKEIFKAKTLKNIAELVANKNINDAEKSLSVTKQTFKDVTEQCLSSAQASYQKEPTNSYTNVKIAFKLKPNVDVERLIIAIEKEVKRQQILRSKIYDGFQIVDDTPFTVKQEKIDRNRYFSHVFNLQQEIPIKANIYNGEFTCVIDHIAFDGWSTSIFLDEIEAFYRGKDLPELPYQYKDFAKCQQNFLNGTQAKRQIDYWQHELSCYQPLLLPVDQTQIESNQLGDDVYIRLDDELYHELKVLVVNEGTTMHNLLLTVYFVLLFRVTRNNAISIAVPTVGRNVTGVENLIGLFINQFLITIDLDSIKTFSDLLKIVDEKMIAAQNNQDIPLPTVLEKLNISVTGNRAYFGIQGFKREALKHSSLFTSIPEMNQETVKDAFTDLAIFVWGQTIDINYAQSLFTRSKVEKFAGVYKDVLKQMIENIDGEI